MTNEAKLKLLFAGIQTARKLEVKSIEARQLIYKALDDLGIDFYAVKTNAKNSDNLFEAIFSYICYGEYSIDGLIKEIRAACKEDI